MKVLGFAGFPMCETYTIIKAISKKKRYIIEGAKEKFIPNFAQAIINTKETEDMNVALPRDGQSNSTLRFTRFLTTELTKAGRQPGSPRDFAKAGTVSRTCIQ